MISLLGFIDAFMPEECVFPVVHVNGLCACSFCEEMIVFANIDLIIIAAMLQK